MGFPRRSSSHTEPTTTHPPTGLLRTGVPLEGRTLTQLLLLLARRQHEEFLPVLHEVKARRNGYGRWIGFGPVDW